MRKDECKIAVTFLQHLKIITMFQNSFFFTKSNLTKVTTLVTREYSKCSRFEYLVHTSLVLSASTPEMKGYEEMILKVEVGF